MRPWLVWSAGLMGYITAVLNRTTFGVSGLDAADRFGASPGVLSSFMVLQVIVYTGTQIPAGLLLDRVGSRSMLVTGLLVMSAGQAALGVTTSLPVAVAGYATVGFGDAFMFISVIRLVPNWFPPQQTPLVTQLTAICGQLGQVLSAVPFLALLVHQGWTVAYLAVAGLGVLVVALTLAVVHDRPAPARTVAPPRTLRTALAGVKAAWAHQGTRLGFFTHMGTQFSITVFVMMWGFPWLTRAQGLSRGTAGGLLTLSVGVFIAVGVLVGIFSGRHPQRRIGLVLSTIVLIALTWTIVLVLPFPAPRWLLVVLVVVTSAGQPVSVVAFDFARTANAERILGTADGMVNTGGHLASLLVMQAMGVIIGAVGGYSLDAFRAAWTVQYAVWVIAVAGILITGRTADGGG